MLFPQMAKTDITPAPQYDECWDSYGDKTILTKSGLQAAGLKKMIDRLQSTPKSVNLNYLQQNVQFVN
jgi:hypothetical protein